MFLYRLYETFLNLPIGLQVVLLFLLFMYILHLVDSSVFKNGLANSYGLKPRQGNKLLSPVLAHTLHSNWKHLFGNSIAFTILGSIIALTNVQSFWVATISIMIVGSLGTWLIGSNGSHRGASGLVTGYFGYVVFEGFLNQNPPSALLGIVVGIFYFGLFRSVFGRFKGVSNVMHFFGFLGGVLGAWIAPFLVQ